MNLYRYFGKRLFDLVLSITGFLLLLLPGFLVYLVIICKEGRPGLFTQERIGRYARPFIIYKFRTMSTNKSSNTVTAANDPRITPLGSFLRKTKIDEWPQLLNIVKGDMSFVGPRPDVSGFADKLTGKNKDLLNLRPGVTGPATIAFRNEEEILSQQNDPISYNRTVIWPKKVRINLEYEKRHTLFSDFIIIAQTALGR